LEFAGSTIAIDSGLPGDGFACEPAPAALLLTHFHHDHVGGLLALGAGGELAVRGPEDPERLVLLDRLRSDRRIAWQAADVGAAWMVAPGIAATAVPLGHAIPTVGWLIDAGGRRVAWLTDTDGLSPESLAQVRNFQPHVACTDCSFAPGDPESAPKRHHDLTGALATLAAIGAERGVLMHLGHTVEAWWMAHGRSLPPGILVAEDGLRLAV